jgi:hypothetical protein
MIRRREWAKVRERSGPLHWTFAQKTHARTAVQPRHRFLSEGHRHQKKVPACKSTSTSSLETASIDNCAIDTTPTSALALFPSGLLQQSALRSLG